MITLHRLSARPQPFSVNPDMVVHVEATPDTQVTLATGSRYVVSETPEEVAAAVRAWRVRIMAEAMRLSR